MALKLEVCKDFCKLARCCTGSAVDMGFRTDNLCLAIPKCTKSFQGNQLEVTEEATF